MKIGLLTFPIGKVGGIITNVHYLEKGLKELGHTVKKYFITTNTHKKPEKNDFGWECLGFERNNWFEEYLEKINKLDLVIWEVCCPHKTKAYTKETWKICFNIKPPQMAYIHDNYYDKYYPWFREIPLKHQIKMICPYKYMHSSIKGLNAMKTVIDNPIEFEDAGLYNEDKQDLLVDHNNWKSIKHKEIVVTYADKMNCKVILYGDHDTLDYRQIQNHKNFNIIKDKDWTERKLIYEDLKRAKIVTDLCKRGNVKNIYDYTITEAIAFGCIPILQTQLCPNHKDIFVEYISKPHELPTTVNKILKEFNKYQEQRKNNLNFLNKIKPAKIAKDIIDYSKLKYKESVEDTIFSYL